MRKSLLTIPTSQMTFFVFAVLLLIILTIVVSPSYSGNTRVTTTAIIQQANAIPYSTTSPPPPPTSLSPNYYYYYRTSTSSTTATPTTMTISSIPAASSTVTAKPVAISIASPQIVDQGGSVTLDGSKSYSLDGSAIYYYSWIQISGPSVGALGATAVTTFKAPSVEHDTQLQFQLTVKDSKGAASSAYASIIVKNGNHPPIAYSQSIQTAENTAVNIELKATDPDPGDTLGYALVSQPLHGQLNNLNPTFTGTTYIPSPGFSGSDSFTFQAFDKDRAVSNVATVYITVIKVNHPPIAYSQSIQTAQNTAVNIELKATDPDPGDTITTYIIVSLPTRGTINNFDQSSGKLTYTPSAGFTTGTDSFTFNGIDNHGAVSNRGIVSITVNPAPTVLPEQPQISSRQ
jgi:Big-like domain-containing protein/K319-like protein